MTPFVLLPSIRAKTKQNITCHLPRNGVAHAANSGRQQHSPFPDPSDEESDPRRSRAFSGENNLANCAFQRESKRHYASSAHSLVPAFFFGFVPGVDSPLQFAHIILPWFTTFFAFICVRQRLPSVCVCFLFSFVCFASSLSSSLLRVRLLVSSSSSALCFTFVFATLDRVLGLPDRMPRLQFVFCCYISREMLSSILVFFSISKGGTQPGQRLTNAAGITLVPVATVMTSLLSGQR